MVTMYSSQAAKEHAEQRYEQMQKDYPRTVHAAYHYVLGMLSLHAPHKVPCFKGECAVDILEFSDLNFAFFRMASILEQELQGNPKITPTLKEAICRGDLKLPPLVLERSQQLSE